MDIIEDWKDVVIALCGAFFGFAAFVGCHFIPVVGPLILTVLDLIGAPGWWAMGPFIIFGAIGALVLRKRRF